MAQKASTEWQAGSPGKPDPAAFKPPHDNPDAVEHQMIKEQGKDEGGKEMSHVHAPVVSLNPTSASPAKKRDSKLIEQANFKLGHYLDETRHSDVEYSLEDIDINQGLFIPVKEGETTDALMSDVYKKVDKYRKQNSEIERDENGDDIMEDVAINVKIRNEDGTVQLDGGKPRLTIKSGYRPKLVGPNFVVKAVVKGDKIGENNEADSDGALVIRLG